MPRYLISLTDANAARLEALLGGRIKIEPSYGPLADEPGIVISGLDAVFGYELQAVDERLRTSGPRYHHGGPTGAQANALRAGPDPYGGRGIRVGDHWEPPLGEAPSDEALGLEPPPRSERDQAAWAAPGADDQSNGAGFRHLAATMAKIRARRAAEGHGDEPAAG